MENDIIKERKDGLKAEPIYRFSIKLKFLIIIISAIIFTSATILIFFVNKINLELTNEFEKRGFSEVAHLAYDADYGIYTEDTVILNHLVEGRVKKPNDIVYIMIMRADGVIIAASNKQKNKPLQKEEHTLIPYKNEITKSILVTENGDTIYEFTAPVTGRNLAERMDDSSIYDIFMFSNTPDNSKNRDQISGYVKIGYSIENIEKIVNDTIYLGVIAIIVVITITFIIAYHFISVIVNPIRKVAQVAREISNGNLSKSVNVKRTDDEVGVMAANFNNMTAILNNTINELERLKNNLAIEVEMRTHDLKLANNKLTAANRELMSLNDMKADFIFNVSHDFRTPLTSIIGYARALADSVQVEIINRLDILNLDDKEQKIFSEEIHDIREGLDVIVSEGERLGRLINLLLDLAKMEAGSFEWYDEDVDLSELLKLAISGITYLLKEKKLVLSIDNDNNIPIVHCDKDRLVRVFVNLLSNAIKFTNLEGVIICSLQQKEEEIEFSITDNGIGIKEEDITDIFVKFKRGSNKMIKKSTGTGLGLPICKEIISHYGGSIWAESIPGEGSVFKFTIPTRKNNHQLV